MIRLEDSVWVIDGTKDIPHCYALTKAETPSGGQNRPITTSLFTGKGVSFTYLM